jgi:hypothetical protein
MRGGKMTTEKQSAKKARQHTVYKVDGEKVPGVTTILGVMNKPALVPWANKLGLAGIEVGKYVDDLAIIGTCGHYLIECHIQSVILGQEIAPELSDYSPNQVKAAENCLGKFLEWEKRTDVKYISSELELVSNTYKFGGTIDILAEVRGKKTLLDIKTCKALYGEHYSQVGGGYKILAEDNGYKIDNCMIIRVGRDDVEGFEEKEVPQVELHMKRFLVCKELYEINKQIGR